MISKHDRHILECIANSLKAKKKLEKRLTSFNYASDFLLEAIEQCERDTNLLPGAFLMRLKRLDPKLNLAVKIYEEFRDPEVVTGATSHYVCYNTCLLAACFAYAYCLEENL